MRLTCLKCLKRYALGQLVKGIRYKYGRRRICTSCWNQRQRTYRTPDKQRQYNQRAYQKIRKNPVRWQAILQAGRLRFARLGHKKFPSICIVCGKHWLGIMRPRRFCSQKCISQGVHNGRWNGGRYINRQGYVLVWSPQHSTRYQLEHRLIMEQAIGRGLKKDEDVHHRNGIKTDNRVSNLQLLTDSEHSRLHANQNRLKRTASVTI